MITTYGNDPGYTNLYDGLTVVARDGTVGPALATDWKAVNATTWQFKLRQEVKFHNGDAFTAADVKYSLERIKDPANKSPVASSLANVRDVQIVDPYTVNITTAVPFAVLPALIGYRLRIVPSELIKRIGNTAFAANPVGTGPFKFVEWIVGSRIVEDANESYWNGPPGVRRVTYLPAPEASTRTAMLLNGEADLIEHVLDADIPRIKDNAKLKVITAESTQNVWVAINTQAPFNDARVRQAMNYAIDVNSIITKVMGSHATRVNISACHLCFGYDSGLAPYSYDPARAKQLLAEAGYDSGHSFPPQLLDVGQGRQPNNVEVSEAIAGYLTAVGIPTKVNVMESSAQFNKYLSAKGILMFNATTSGTVDVNDQLGLNLHSKQRALYWRSTEFDGMLDAALGEFDLQKRKQMYSQVFKYIFNAAPHIFLYDTIDVYASRANLDWAGPTASGEIPLWSARFR